MIRDRKRGKRAGKSARLHREILKDLKDQAERRDIHSKVYGVRRHNLVGTSVTATIEDRAKYVPGTNVEETEKDHIVPRQSLTRKQHLMVFPQTTETVTDKARQLDHKSGNMIETTDERVTWRSDKSLLEKRNPFRNEKNIGTFKREGYVKEGLNKRRTLETTTEEIHRDQEEIPNALPENFDTL